MNENHDELGRFASADSAGRGVVKNAVYAGVTEDQWHDWAHYSDEINDLHAGLDVKHDSDGHEMSSADKAEFKRLAEKIQTAAENHVALLPAGIAFRGESFDSLEEVKAAYPVNRSVTLGKLTSVTPDFGAAKEYAGGKYPVLVRVQQSGEGIQGVQTAPLGVPSNEIVMPRGMRFTVAKIHASGTFPGTRHTVVDLYKKEPAKGTKMNAVSPSENWAPKSFKKK